MFGHAHIVRHHHDSRALRIEFAEQLNDLVAGEITEADARVQGAGALQALAPREAAIDHWQCDVVCNRVAPEQIVRLKHETEKAVTYLRQLGIRTTRDLAGFEQVVTGARHVETAED